MTSLAYRNLLYSVLLLLVSALLAGCPNGIPAGTDLTVQNIEITQGIQTPTNTIQLVANRSTAVRVTVGTAVSQPVPGVTGRLHVFVNGSAITPAGGLAPINSPFTAPPSPQRANENDTLNFEGGVLNTISASNDVDFQVEVSVAGESNTGNNTGSVDNLSFVNRTTPNIFFTRVNYTPAGLGLPALALVQSGVGDAFVQGIFPVNDNDPNLYRQGLFPTLSFSLDSNNNNILDGNDVSELLSFLSACRQLIVTAGLGATNNTFLYGWLAGNPIDGNGWAPISGFVGFGNTELIRHQRTFAHELGHNFGLNHNSRFLDEVGWDVGNRLQGNPAGNNTTGRAKPTTLRDIMVGGQLSNSAWVDTITYNFFLGSPILASTGELDSAQQDLQPRVLVVRGIFDEEGRELLRLEPAFRFPWPSQPTRRDQEGQFVAQVIDSAQVVTEIRFNAQLGDDAGEAPGVGEPFGFFEVMVPVNPELEVVSLRITDERGEVTFGSFGRSEPPVITIVAPQEGAELGEQTEVAWELRDPDTELEALQLQVAYSPDNGESWVPVAVNVPGSETSVVFDSTEIQRSQGRGVIRVFTSDGLNTVFDEVRGLTTTAAQYE